MTKKILIVSSNYYEKISNNLISGATQYLVNNEIINKKINVPGSFEIPFTINKYKDLFDGFIALGCIIKGETYHFEVISNNVTRKIIDLSIAINKPIGFGILTCNNLDQALKRSDPSQSNKGFEAAKACVDLLNLR